MEYTPIRKSPDQFVVKPNLIDYEAVRTTLSWDDIRHELDGLPGGKGLNIAHEAIDRHANGPRRDHLAMRWLGAHDEVRDFTYGDLKEQSNRFANVLVNLDVG